MKNHFKKGDHRIKEMVANIKGVKNPYEISKKLTKKVQEDFENGKVLQVDGWYISRTEAEFYFAIYLSTQQTG